MKTLAVVVFFLLPLQALPQTVYTVETVPNVKLSTNSYVSNPDGIISPAAVVAIDSVLYSLEKSTQTQVAVVLVNSIGEADHVDFAQKLFEYWGPGFKGKDNGLLVLLIGDQRTIRFHTGDGLEAILPDAVCKQIQREFMVPFFKTGDYDQAMINGIQAIAGRVSDPSVAIADESMSQESSAPIPMLSLTMWLMAAWFITALVILITKLRRRTFAASDSAPQVRYSAFGWTIWFLFTPLVLIFALSLTESFWALASGLYSYIAASFALRQYKLSGVADTWLDKKEYYAVYQLYNEHLSTFSALRFFLPLPFAFLYSGFKRKMDSIRNHPRDCNQCGQPLHKLDENADNDQLSKGQLMEETLKSVDYDVWRCRACNASEKLAYLNADSKYTDCPKCSTRTYYLQSDRTVRSATTSSEGTGEKIRHCKFCNNRNVETYTIARIQESSSSSGGSGSSGGSWGGGSSGGGGASSSW